MTMSLVVEHFDDLLAIQEDVEQLNRAILQLAVQGKLVKQNPNDEPADELLKHIKAENTKENKPTLEITEDECPFELPSGWKWVRLGELCRLENGDRSKENYPNKSILVKEGVPFVNAGHLVNGRIDQNTITFIPKEKFDQLRSGKFTNGDILFCLRGSLGKSAIVEGFDAGAIASSLVILKIHPYLSNYYLLNYFDSPLAYEMIKKYDNGTAQPNLSAASLAKFLVPLPPLAEQQRIVARVEELFAQTSALAQELTHSQIELDGLNQSALSHLLASETPEEFNQHWEFIAEHFDLLFQTPEHVTPLRQSILELAVRGKLTRREAGDESAWEEKELRDIAEIIDSLHITPTYAEHGFPMVRATEIKHGFLDISNARKVDEKTFKEFSKKHMPKIGDVVLSRVGASYGTSSLVNSDEPFCLGQNTVFLVPKISPNYFYYFLNSPKAKDQMAKLVSGSAQPTISLKSLGDLIVPVQSLAEQERIVKRVEELLSLCDALEARLQSAEEERGRLVAAVMSTVGG